METTNILQLHGKKANDFLLKLSRRKGKRDEYLAYIKNDYMQMDVVWYQHQCPIYMIQINMDDTRKIDVYLCNGDPSELHVEHITYIESIGIACRRLAEEILNEKNRK